MGFGFVGDALGKAKNTAGAITGGIADRVGDTAASIEDRTGTIGSAVMETVHTGAYLTSEFTFAPANFCAHIANAPLGKDILPEIHLVEKSDTIRKVEAVAAPLLMPVRAVDSLNSAYQNAALYAAIQTPLDGITQLINKGSEALGEGKLLPHLDLIEPPKQSESLSPEWLAVQVGTGVGTILPFFVGGAGAVGVVGRVTAIGSKAFFGVRAAEGATLGSRIIPVIRAAGAGFSFNFLTQPVSDEDSGGDFFASRFRNGLLGAASFGTQGATSIGLRSLPGFARAFSAPVQHVVVETTSGIVGGVVDAELQSGFRASPRQLLESVVTNVVVGNVLGPIGGDAHRGDTTGDAVRPNTTGDAKPDLSILTRPPEELSLKLSNLKRDLGIKMWDPPSVQRQKLIEDMTNFDRLLLRPSGSLHQGNTRYYFAKLLGIADADIQVKTSDGQKMSLADFRTRRADAQGVLRTPHLEVTDNGVKIDGVQHPLYSLGDSWVYGKISSKGVYAWTKLHIQTTDAADLHRLQAHLIPELNNPDSEIGKLVDAYKTFHPGFGVGITPPSILHPELHYPGKMDPTRAGILDSQAVKGFTIYANSPANVARLQELLNQFLVERGLSLPEPIPGQLDAIVPGANRVGVVRETFTRSVDLRVNEIAAPVTGIRIDESVAAQIHREFDKSLDAKLTFDELRLYEDRLGLQRDTLGYDTTGSLGIVNSHLTPHSNGLYAPEGGAQSVPRKPGDDPGTGLNNRPAIYEIYRRYGIDPADIVHRFQLSQDLTQRPHLGESLGLVAEDGLPVTVEGFDTLSGDVVVRHPGEDVAPLEIRWLDGLREVRYQNDNYRADAAGNMFRVHGEQDGRAYGQRVPDLLLTPLNGLRDP